MLYFASIILSLILAALILTGFLPLAFVFAFIPLFFLTLFRLDYKTRIYIILLYAIIGCAGIRGTGSTIDEEPTAIKTNKIFKGKVSQVNEETHEITINGVQISSLGAQIYRNSVLLPNDGLRAGQIISVETLTSSKKGKYSALKIEIEDQLEGPVEAIDSDLNTISILGQTVHVTLATSFTQKSLKTLKLNYYLAVFGFKNEKGILEATLIEFIREEFQASKDTVKIAGEVAEVNVETGNIVVEGVEIKLGEEEIKDIKVGDVLTLNGLEVNEADPNTLITTDSSTNIQEEVKTYDVNSEIVLEGLPQKIVARNIFTLNGYQVVVPLEYMDANNIDTVEGRKIIVSGVFTAEKEVLASNLRVEKIKDFEFRGALKTTGKENKIAIFDKEIDVNIYTSIDFNLVEILTQTEKGVIAPTIYVKGYVDDEGNRVATVLSINPDDKEQFEFIKGKIESIDNDVITISGVSIRLNSFIILKNENRNVNITELLTMIAVTDKIEVFGGFSSDSMFLAYFLNKNNLLDSTGDKSQTVGSIKKSKSRKKLK